MRVAAWLSAGLIGAAPSVAHPGPIVAETLRVPVKVSTQSGLEVRQVIDVAVVREAAPRPRPFLVLQHGRAAETAQRRRLALPIYPANSRYFAAQGFVVLIPLRIGYGVASGPDVEDTGDCGCKRFGAGVAPAVAETREVLRFAATLPYVAHRGLVVGESFGGLIAVAAAAARLDGVQGAVNIEGGDGGDSLRHPDEPCQPEALRATFAGFGRTSRMPTLWMYSRNDRFWGPDHPRQWYAAFTGAGGRGEFVDLPADKNNGHFIFNRNALAWHPAFEAFIARLGLPAPRRVSRAAGGWTRESPGLRSTP